MMGIQRRMKNNKKSVERCSTGRVKKIEKYIWLKGLWQDNKTSKVETVRVRFEKKKNTCLIH